MSTKSPNNQTLYTVLIILLVLISLVITLYTVNKNIIPNGAGKKSYIIKTDKNNFSFIPSDNIIQTDSAKIKQEMVKLKDHPTDVVLLEGSFLTLNQNPKLLIWMLLFAMMMATAFGLIFPLGAQIWKIIKSLKPDVLDILLITALVLLLGAGIVYTSTGNNSGKLLSAFYIIDKFDVLIQDTKSLFRMIFIVIVVGLLAVYGMLVVIACASRLSASQADTVLKDYQMLNDALKFFLTAISVLIMYSVVTTALMQQSLDAAISVKGLIMFPSEFIYAYGLIFTIFLAVIYLPVQYRLREHAKAISASLPIVPSDEKLKELGLKESPLKNLQVFLSILAPVLGSVFSEVVKHISQ